MNFRRSDSPLNDEDQDFAYDFGKSDYDFPPVQERFEEDKENFIENLNDKYNQNLFIQSEKGDPVLSREFDQANGLVAEKQLQERPPQQNPNGFMLDDNPVYDPDNQDSIYQNSTNANSENIQENFSQITSLTKQNLLITSLRHIKALFNDVIDNSYYTVDQKDKIIAELDQTLQTISLQVPNSLREHSQPDTTTLWRPNSKLKITILENCNSIEESKTQNSDSQVQQDLQNDQFESQIESSQQSEENAIVEEDSGPQKQDSIFKDRLKNLPGRIKKFMNDLINEEFKDKKKFQKKYAEQLGFYFKYMNDRTPNEKTQLEKCSNVKFDEHHYKALIEKMDNDAGVLYLGLYLKFLEEGNVYIAQRVEDFKYEKTKDQTKKALISRAKNKLIHYILNNNSNLVDEFYDHLSRYNKKNPDSYLQNL